jgi:hypothetical protein
MKTGGSNAQRLAIEEFLFAFDDDPVQAVRALREYIHKGKQQLYCACFASGK